MQGRDRGMAGEQGRSRCRADDNGDDNTDDNPAPPAQCEPGSDQRSGRRVEYSWGLNGPPVWYQVGRPACPVTAVVTATSSTVRPSDTTR